MKAASGFIPKNPLSEVLSLGFKSLDKHTESKINISSEKLEGYQAIALVFILLCCYLIRNSIAYYNEKFVHDIYAYEEWLPKRLKYNEYIKNGGFFDSPPRNPGENYPPQHGLWLFLGSFLPFNLDIYFANVFGIKPNPRFSECYSKADCFLAGKEFNAQFYKSGQVWLPSLALIPIVLYISVICIAMMYLVNPKRGINWTLAVLHNLQGAGWLLKQLIWLLPMIALLYIFYSLIVKWAEFQRFYEDIDKIGRGVSSLERKRMDYKYWFASENESWNYLIALIAFPFEGDNAFRFGFVLCLLWLVPILTNVAAAVKGFYDT